MRIATVIILLILTLALYCLYKVSPWFREELGVFSKIAGIVATIIAMVLLLLPSDTGILDITNTQRPTPSQTRTKPPNSKVADSQTLAPVSGYAFYGIRDGDGWLERHFRITGSIPTSVPQVGDSVRALDSVNIRSAVIEYIPSEGWVNAPAKGVLVKDTEIRVLEVIPVTNNPDFIWIRFEPL